MHFLKNIAFLFVFTIMLTSFRTKVVPNIQKDLVLNDCALNDYLWLNSVQTSYANRNITLSVMRGRTKEEAYEIVQSTILSYFDVLEADNANSGYLRTAWVGTNFKNNTKRVRIIIRKSGSNPVKFSLKFVSQESGVAGTSYTDDEKYKNINSIPNSYDGLIEELTARLKN